MQLTGRKSIGVGNPGRCSTTGTTTRKQLVARNAWDGVNAGDASKESWSTPHEQNNGGNHECSE